LFRISSWSTDFTIFSFSPLLPKLEFTCFTSLTSRSQPLAYPTLFQFQDSSHFVALSPFHHSWAYFHQIIDAHSFPHVHHSSLLLLFRAKLKETGLKISNNSTKFEK
jgi:hypothetical protein